MRNEDRKRDWMEVQMYLLKACYASGLVDDDDYRNPHVVCGVILDEHSPETLAAMRLGRTFLVSPTVDEWIR